MILKECFRKRFEDNFKDEILKAMKWFDNTNWTNEKDYAHQDFEKLYKHFTFSLDSVGYEPLFVKREWASVCRFISANIVTCKICTVHLQQIRVEARKRNLRGEVLNSLLKYADGINSAHKGNVEKHIRSGGLHDWAKKKFSKSAEQGPVLGATPTDVTGSSKSSAVLETNQPTIKQSFSSPGVNDNYKRLFVTASLYMALKERPLSDFSSLIDLQRKNGLLFFQNKTHEKACATFIDCLAHILQQDLFNILQSINFYSITMDRHEKQERKKSCCTLKL